MRVDPTRQPFPVLIGGSDWGAELDSAEAVLLQQGVKSLLQQLQQSAASLMPDESIELELDQGGLWLQLVGLPAAWRLRFVLCSSAGGSCRGRGLEAGWSSEASSALAAALQAVVIPSPK